MPDLESKLWFLDRKKITILSHDTDRDFGLINLSDGRCLDSADIGSKLILNVLIERDLLTVSGD